MTHSLQKTIKQIDGTHKGLGAMIAMNLVCAKAKMCILNVAPSGCGKSVSTDAVTGMLGEVARRYTSLTLAGLKHEMAELKQFNGHMLIDDLGGEKSEWSRVSTVTVLANLIYGHYIKKVTYSGTIEIDNFYGSASLNIQPVLMQSIIGDSDWIAVIRDKVLRYYHLIRPTKPDPYLSNPTINYSIPLQEVMQPTYKGKLWYQLVAIGLTQWSYGRIVEHLPKLLKSCAAFDGRTHVELEDYRLLAKLMKPMQLERYLVQSYGFESGRTFDNNTYCILVELASHGKPSIETICEDYKCSPETVTRLIQSSPEWCWIKQNSPRHVMPTEHTDKILRLAGVTQKW